MFRRFAFAGLITVCSGILALHGSLARYAHPMADDFSYSLRQMPDGWLEANRWEYLHWNGRFASNPLVLADPLRWGFEGIKWYRCIPIALLLLLCASTFILLHTVFQGKNGRAALIGAIVAPVVFLHLMPDMPEGLYWYTGAVTYTLPYALLLLAVAAYVAHKRGGSFLFSLVAFGLLGLCVGFNETMMAFVVLGVSLERWITRPRGRLESLKHALPLLAVLFCAGVMFCSPGNAQRTSYFGGTHDLWHSFGMSLLQTIRFGGLWILDGLLIALSLLWLIGHRRIEELLPHARNGFGLSRTMAFVLLFAPVFLAAFLPYWNTGILGQHRTMNTACFFFLPLWFVNLSVWRPWLEQRLLRVRTNTVLVPLLFALCIADLLATGNSHAALADLLTGRAERSNDQLWQRYRSLEAAKNRGDAEARVPLIADPPKSLYILDLKEAEYLSNRDYAAWFGVSRVSSDGAGVEAASASNAPVATPTEAPFCSTLAAISKHIQGYIWVGNSEMAWRGSGMFFPQEHQGCLYRIGDDLFVLLEEDRNVADTTETFFADISVLDHGHAVRTSFPHSSDFHVELIQDTLQLRFTSFYREPYRVRAVYFNGDLDIREYTPLHRLEADDPDHRSAQKRTSSSVKRFHESSSFNSAMRAR